MDCLTAQTVYLTGNEQDILNNIKHKFATAWEYLHNEVQNFMDRKAEKFDSSVKALLDEDCPKNFRVTHRDDESELSVEITDLLGDLTSRLLLQDYFTKLHNTPIFLGTICCSGCITADRELNLPELIAIQSAAVKIEPTT